MGFYLEQGADDLHMVQVMPLPPHHFCFSNIQNHLSFWYQLTQIVLKRRSNEFVVVVAVHVFL